MSDQERKDRKREQNRKAQQIYRKSILKRLEELERKFEEHFPEPQSSLSLKPATTPSNWLHPHVPFCEGDPRSPIFSGSLSSVSSPPNPIFPDPPQPMRFSPSPLISFVPQPPAIGGSQSPTTPRTSLAHAVHRGDESILHALLETGAVNLDAPVTGRGEIALHLAVQRGDLCIVDMLLNAGANVNAVNSSNQVALHFAVEHGNEEMVRLLVMRGANVNRYMATEGGTSLEAATMLLPYTFERAGVQAHPDIVSKDIVYRR